MSRYKLVLLGLFLENGVSVTEASIGKCQENCSSKGKTCTKRYNNIKEMCTNKTTSKFLRPLHNFQLMF